MALKKVLLSLIPNDKVPGDGGGAVAVGGQDRRRWSRVEGAEKLLAVKDVAGGGRLEGGGGDRSSF